MPANFAPGASPRYFLVATNVGAKATAATTILEVALPEALEPSGAAGSNSTPGAANPKCEIAPHLVRCETTDPVGSGNLLRINVAVDVSAAPGDTTTLATIRGGSAPEAATSVTPPLQAAPVPFAILAPGLHAPLTNEDGTPNVLAASHPYQQTVSFGFPTAKLEAFQLTNSGHPRDIFAELPAGLIGDPAASPDLCSEAELQTLKCPPDSQVGVFDLTTLLGEASNPAVATSPLYNMVPPPGSPAELATNVASVGIFPHLIASVRSDGDYGIEIAGRNTLALGTQPIFGIQTQIWGDPSSKLHNAIRGNCLESPGSCPLSEQDTAFLTLPGTCPAEQLTTALRSDTWEEPAAFQESTYQSADLSGNPISLSGCNQLSFEPTIAARPTTNLIDSPSGLDVDLHQPQDTDKNHRSTAQLRDAAVTLPAGMSVNPSQADGLGACTSAQIGLATPVGVAPIHFDKTANSCPDAAKLGTVEVTTPLLVQRNEAHQLEIDPETGNPIPAPLHGSVYLAKPYDNPFDSLLAIYLAVEDPATGTIAKLAGEIEADPKTGQLTTYFEENPQLPLEHVRLHLYSGARASLITPPTCATHTTTTELIPWSAPEGTDATPSDSFQTSASPAGGACPASESALPNTPTFSAGTIGRQAGAYSPFSLKLSREDGTARLTKLETTLPPGLAARFAGVGECTNAQIAAALAREAPNQGILERNDPSCPASSRLGTATVAAGAGPTPFYTQGSAYLAGPYKGAPFSLAIITPAIAGPFDLGAVVVRTALYVDSETAQGRAVSDPLPTIIDGIPLDLRSVAIELDRPGFTLNPTSCDPLAITGSATSALGATAALTTPFQVGGCSSLPFKPKLSLSLKGGVKRTSHPRLLANLTAKPGEANIARAQVKLPKAAFLDNAHIKTICTKVQFAADACPPGSVYGKASATTPLLDGTLSGAVYLRSSTHQLPDLVAKLKGPAAQPIEIDLAGRTDSVNGALRNTFEAVPDAPVTKFNLELYGGKRGLIILSSGLCKSPKANVELDGQNGKVFDTNPVVKTSCKKGGGKKKGGGGKKRHSGGRGGR
jgi:hypothetical protein